MTPTRWAWLLVLLLPAGCSGSSGTADGGTSGHSDAGHSDGGLTGSTGASPAPTSISPTSGPTDGGTAVVIKGSGFGSGATVRIGSVALGNVQVLSPDEIHGITAPGPAGQADVIVVNPDSRVGTLSHGFTYVSPSTGPTVGWCNIQFPVDPTGVAGTALDLYGRVYVAGVTDQAGQGQGVSMQAGVSAGDGGIAWQDATYNVDVPSSPGSSDLNNDEYVLHTTFPSPPGTYQAAFRAKVGSGDWTYCEKDGTHSAYDPAFADVVTTTAPQQGQLSWCNLQFPPSLQVAPGDSFDLYGRVYAAGVTDQAGQGAGIAMQAGVGQPDGGGFTWSDATYSSDVASSPGASDLNNDEYRWTGAGPAPGSYGTAFRAALGDGGWSYCGLAGLGASLDAIQLGALTSAVPPPPKVDWCALQFPLDASGAPGAPVSLYGQVYEPGVTDQAGQGSGLQMQAGLGSADGGWTWSDATYNRDANNNDEYVWNGTDPSAPGTYLTAFRAMLTGGPWVYCERSGPSDQLDVTQAGTLTVSAAAPPTVSWCNLQFPTQLQLEPDSGFVVYGRVYAPGVTDQAGQGAGIAMDFGLGFDDGGWSWQQATYNTDVSSYPSSTDINNDEYLVNAPAQAVGNYQMAFRASLDGGPFTYCEVDGPHPSIDVLHAAPLTVGDTASWCNLQYPAQYSGAAGSTATYYGQVFLAGVTDQAGQGAGLELQLGYGPGDGGWTWQGTTYNTDVGNNDEYQADLTLPAAGSYFTLFRARESGGPWLYCEPDGPHLGIDVGDAGTLTSR